MRKLLCFVALLMAAPVAAQAPAAQWTATTFDFGLQNVGSDTPLTISLQNNTSAQVAYNLFLEVNSGQNPGEPECPFFITSPTFDNTNNQLIVPANSSTSVVVEFRPTVPGAKNVTIVAADPNGVQYAAWMYGDAQ